MTTQSTAYSEPTPYSVRLAWWLAVVGCAPLLLLQAIWLRLTVPRLPEAAGPVTGRAGKGENALRLLVVGESTAVGVGAPDHASGLPGQLAEALQEAGEDCVRWQVAGQSGLRAATLIDWLREQTGKSAATLDGNDLVVVILGVNDTLGLCSERRWMSDYHRLVDLLLQRNPGAQVVCAGVPPIHRFPALPQPLRWLAGLHARRLDRCLRSLCNAQGWTWVAVPDLNGIPDAEVRQTYFCADRFHPSPNGYRRWAMAIVEALRGQANSVQVPLETPQQDVDRAGAAVTGQG